jgi:hypothetical protein
MPAGADMASSPLSKLASMIFLSLPVQAEMPADYPAPPGVYGQEEILKNSKLNLGKGAPYVVITDTEELDNSTGSRAVSVPEKPSAQNRNYIYPVEQLPEDLPPPPNQYQVTEEDYPSAEQLDEQYRNAQDWSFEQWGEEPVEVVDSPIDFRAAPNQSQYDYPQPNRFYQGTGKSNFLSSYPPLNSATSRQPYSHQSHQLRPGQLRPGELPPSQFQPGNYGQTPDPFYRNNWANAPLTPPANLDLQHFEHFPVPQDLYGNAPNNSQPSGSADYFQKIPEEEIIYPPNYPGLR